MLNHAISARPLAKGLPASTTVLWACIGLFFARVVGQIEVLLVEPHWLPAMQAWYSGILPYPLLLPIQIALLVLMGVLAIRTRAPRERTGAAARTSKILRTLAVLYVAGMAVRLILIVHLYGRDYYLHGAIPVVFHWVLGLFVLVWTRLTYGR
jgi:ABC-type xylose transport system permease subunit